MSQAEKDYPSVGHRKRIDLALSIDVHQSNSPLHHEIFAWKMKNSDQIKQ